jgi:hypothetical protein
MAVATWVPCNLFVHLPHHVVIKSLLSNQVSRQFISTSRRRPGMMTAIMLRRAKQHLNLLAAIATASLDVTLYIWLFATSKGFGGWNSAGIAIASLAVACAAWAALEWTLRRAGLAQKLRIVSMMQVCWPPPCSKPSTAFVRCRHAAGIHAALSLDL